MARLLTVDPAAPDPTLVAEAAAIIRTGGLVAFPTETVYGLGADAFNARAVARIFEAKGRPSDDPIIVHVLGMDDAMRVAAAMPAVAARLADAFWPGPLTLVVPRAAAVPGVVTAGLDSVAIRAPAHPVARALIMAAGTPIAAPSANPFGRTSPTTAAHVRADLGDRIEMILDGGPATVGLESTVVDCRNEPPVVLRPGGVTLEALRAVVPGIRLRAFDSELGSGATGAESEAESDPTAPSAEAHADAVPRSPGLLARHYAPRATVVLVVGASGDVRQAIAQATVVLTARGLRVGVLAADEDVAAIEASAGAQGVDPDPQSAAVRTISLGPLGDAATAARRLFGALRDLDAAGADVIVARDFGDAGLALAVRDRLTRAAEGRVVSVPAGGIEAGVGAILAVLDHIAADGEGAVSQV